MAIQPIIISCKEVIKLGMCFFKSKFDKSENFNKALKKYHF